MDHPNVIRMYEIYEDYKYIYLVFEYCSGGELFDDLMKVGRYDEKTAAGLL